MHKRVHHGVEDDGDDEEEERYAPILSRVGAPPGGEDSTIPIGVAGWSGGEEERVNSGGASTTVQTGDLEDLDVSDDRDQHSRRAHRRQASTHQVTPSFLYSVLPIRLVKVRSTTVAQAFHPSLTHLDFTSPRPQ